MEKCPMEKCPMCNGEVMTLDPYCTLCDGEHVVTQSQAEEWRRQNPTETEQIDGK